MRGLDPRIHVFAKDYSWMAGTSPAMTTEGCYDGIWPMKSRLPISMPSSRRML